MYDASKLLCVCVITYKSLQWILTWQRVIDDAIFLIFFFFWFFYFSQVFVFLFFLLFWILIPDHSLLSGRAACVNSVLRKIFLNITQPFNSLSLSMQMVSALGQAHWFKYYQSGLVIRKKKNFFIYRRHTIKSPFFTLANIVK